MRVIMLDESNEYAITDLNGRTLVRIVVDEVGPQWEATVTVPPYEEKDDEDFLQSEHHFHLPTPY